MKKLIPTLVISLFFCFPVFSQPVDLAKAEQAVNAMLKASGIENQFNILGLDLYRDSTGDALVFMFHLSPTGYIVTSGKMELPPIIAYSFTDDPDAEGRLISLVKADLSLRLQHQSEAMKIRNRMSWETIGEIQTNAVLFQQWPPAGTTSTGGWLETNWTQSAPYNQLCPMDLVTGTRSIAG